jgi:outer membrane usher protein
MCRSHRNRLFAAFLAICTVLFTFSAANASATAATGSATDTASSNGSAITGDVDDARLEQLQSNQTLELAVVVNGSPTGKIGEFVARGRSLFARSEELSRLGFRLPDPPASNGLVLLTGLSGLTTRIDQGSQTLYVIASPQFIAPTVVGDQPGDDFAIESGSGAVLNYDIVGTSADGDRVASGLFDARAFSRYGVVSSGLLVNSSPESSGNGREDIRAVRLDTTYVYSDPGTLRRYRLGDFITGGLPWTRPVRLGGAQVNSDFSMRPDLITFPVPQISGVAAVPSTIDVLVNGSRVASGDIPAGPFEVPQVPIVSGGGTVTTTITDAIGRQVVTQLPFYASSALLAPKLQTYSAEVGFVRRNWGVRSNDYGSAAALMTYRRGISSFLTVETHAEATDGLKMAGAGAVMNLGNFALLNVAAAGSSFEGHSGGQVSAGVQRITPIYSLGGSVTVANRGFGDIAAANGDPVSTFQLNANASLSLSSFGSLGIAYAEIRRAAQPRLPRDARFANSFDFAEPEHSRILTASYSRQFGRVAAYATVFRDFGEKMGTHVMVGLTLPLGRRTSASVSAQASSGARSGDVEVDRAAIVPGDWGFRTFVSANGAGNQAMSGHEFAQLTYKSGFGQVFAGVDHVAGHTIVQAEMRGALALADDGLFASNRIDDSFAIVDTGTAGIRVRQENQDVGRTDSRGRLLVPDLRSFETNQLSIEPLDAPVDAQVTVTRKTVRPQDRSGVVVKFPVKVEHGALLRLVDGSGKPLPVGSSATLESSGAAVPIGYDGETYVVELLNRNRVLVDLPDGGRCAVSFEFKAAANQIPTVGPLTCRESVQ